MHVQVRAVNTAIRHASLCCCWFLGEILLADADGGVGGGGQHC
jgi:hypothetical protein